VPVTKPALLAKDSGPSNLKGVRQETHGVVVGVGLDCRDLELSEHVLDVAAGNGIAALAVPRRFARTGLPAHYQLGQRTRNCAQIDKVCR
jgi:hypothetical protein